MCTKQKKQKNLRVTTVQIMGNAHAGGHSSEIYGTDVSSMSWSNKCKMFLHRAGMPGGAGKRALGDQVQGFN